MKIRAVIGVILIAVGAVWIFQGSGVLKGSFMTGQSLWLWVGILCVVAGAVLLVVALTGAKR